MAGARGLVIELPVSKSISKCLAGFGQAVSSIGQTERDVACDRTNEDAIDKFWAEVCDKIIDEQVAVGNSGPKSLKPQLENVKRIDKPKRKLTNSKTAYESIRGSIACRFYIPAILGVAAVGGTSIRNYLLLYRGARNTSNMA